MQTGGCLPPAPPEDIFEQKKGYGGGEVDPVSDVLTFQK